MKSTEQTRAVAQEIIDRIHADPNCHRQTVWGTRTSCGTTMCVAGHAVDIAQPETVFWWGSVMTTNTGAGSIGMVAQEILGLDTEEADDLFYSNEEDALQKLKKIVVGEEFYDFNS